MPAIEYSLQEIDDESIRKKCLEDALGDAAGIGLDQLESKDLQGPLNLDDIFVTRFLAAKSIDEAGFASPDLRAGVLNALAENTSDPTMQRKLFDQVIKLFKGDKNSEKMASQLLIDYGVGTMDKDWSALALLANVLWHDPPEDLSMGWAYHYGESDRFKNLLKKNRGTLRPKEILREQIEILSRVLGNPEEWGPTSVFAPHFFQSCMKTGDRSVVFDLLDEADRLWENNNSLLAREFALAARFYLTYYRGQYPRFPADKDLFAMERSRTPGNPGSESQSGGSPRSIATLSGNRS